MDFPLLAHNPSLTYLDSAATSLKPQEVLDAMNEYYTSYSANIHRGLYKLSEKASEEYEETRQVVADFIHAPSADEIIFTRNATESINLIAYTCGQHMIDSDNEIVTTVLEHHANFVPWQQLALRRGAHLRVIDCGDAGDLDIYAKNGKIDLTGLVTDKTWILALQHISNVLGTIQPIKDIIKAARAIQPKIIVVVDAAQSAPHIPIDVQDLDCDFLAFSSHKMLGPTGVGVLWGRKRLLDAMPPFLFGGDMIRGVYLDHTDFAEPPYKFEAGTPDIAGVIGLKAAVMCLQKHGIDQMFKREVSLKEKLDSALQKEFEENIHILGSSARTPRIAVAAFTLKGCHPHDIAGILDEENVAVRAGNHCAMPLHTRFGVHATTRASFYLYNDEKDIGTLISALRKAYSILCPSTKK
jgi:cysteine desulfurase/selenocysteine lyase